MAIGERFNLKMVRLKLDAILEVAAKEYPFQSQNGTIKILYKPQAFGHKI